MFKVGDILEIVVPPGEYYLIRLCHGNRLRVTNAPEAIDGTHQGIYTHITLDDPYHRVGDVTGAWSARFLRKVNSVDLPNRLGNKLWEKR